MSEQPAPVSLADDAPLRLEVTRRVTLVGAATNLFLSLAQIFGGIFTQSQAVIADGVHTLSDLATDFLVLFAAHEASREADEEHPYGHQRIETLATVILGLALVLVGIGIGWRAGLRLIHVNELVQPQPLAIFFAALAIVSKEALFHYTRAAGRRIRSNMLMANAWHHRSDVVSSLVVLAGVVGSVLGMPLLDPLAALVVALMIVYMGGGLIRDSVMELIDTGLDAETVQAIRTKILEVEEVQSLHMLRTRRMGGQALADVHIQVSPRISVSEGHQIAETVRIRLIQGFEELADVMVHIDPEDDEEGPPNAGLPLRSELLPQLRAAWQEIPEAEQIRRYQLHYLNGQIEIELYLPLELARSGDEARAQLARRFNEAARQVPGVGRIRLYFC
ncbi:MAG: cation transporter [Gammaproteobacteria bacterium]|nr:MAG: cation transporter [Gammaproteobacteria bacterium]